MRDKKVSKKLYYVDSVKPINHGEKFIVRLLDQTPYSYVAKKVYAEILPGLVDQRLFLYNREKKKEKFTIITEGRQNGFRDGAFVRLDEKSQKCKQKKLLLLRLEDEDIEVYPDKEAGEQTELQKQKQKQKYKEKELIENFNLNLTETTRETAPKLYCFNVGQGDMSLFISSRGHAFIIDTHITDSRKQDILAELKRILGGRPIEALILTHRHYDHYLGAYMLLNDKEFNVKHLIVNQSFLTDPKPNQVDKLLNKAEEKGCRIISSTSEGIINDGSTKLYFSFHSGNTDENDNSILLQIYCDDKLYYLTGDMGYETLEAENLKDTHEQVVLKVSHHGSDTGTSCSFLYRLHRKKINILCQMNNQCIPDYCPIVTNNKAVDCQAFISVGKNNRYGHPKQKCWNQLKYAGFNTILSHSKKEAHCF